MLLKELQVKVTLFSEGVNVNSLRPEGPVAQVSTIEQMVGSDILSEKLPFL